MLNFTDFKKVELRVGRVLEAERIPESDKLLKLKVSFGSEERQILAGIGKKYAPEDLLNKQLVIVANLEPRVMMGLESQGMILASNSDNGPIFLTPAQAVPDGATIQ